MAVFGGFGFGFAPHNIIHLTLPRLKPELPLLYLGRGTNLHVSCGFGGHE
jgi:hypothetical protein